MSHLLYVPYLTCPADALMLILSVLWQKMDIETQFHAKYNNSSSDANTESSQEIQIHTCFVQKMTWKKVIETKPTQIYTDAPFLRPFVSSHLVSQELFKQPPPSPPVSMELAFVIKPSWSEWIQYQTPREKRCAGTRWWNSRYWSLVLGRTLVWYLSKWNDLNKNALLCALSRTTMD